MTTQMYSCAVIDKRYIADRETDMQTERRAVSQVRTKHPTEHAVVLLQVHPSRHSICNTWPLKYKLCFYIRNLNSWFYPILVMSNRLFQRGKTQNRYGHSKLAEMRLMIIIHTETMIILKANNVLYACFLFGPHLQLNSILIWWVERSSLICKWILLDYHLGKVKVVAGLSAECLPPTSVLFPCPCSLLSFMEMAFNVCYFPLLWLLNLKWRGFGVWVWSGVLSL